jgi:hypothetical protein
MERKSHFPTHDAGNEDMSREIKAIVAGGRDRHHLGVRKMKMRVERR